MCFSPEVDVVAGVAIGLVAVDALRHNPSRRSLPVALLPAVLAFHTLTEAFIWWGAEGTVPLMAAEVAAQIYIIVAFVVLPVLVPVAVAMLEPAGWRRTALLVPMAAGVVAAGLYFSTVVTGAASAVACDAYIDYRMVGAPTIAGAAYALATCGALLLSGLQPIRIWGLLNVVAAAGLAYWAAQALPSLWCFWAAATSVLIASVIRQIRRQHDEGVPWPWAGSESTGDVAVVSSIR